MNITKRNLIIVLISLVFLSIICPLLYCGQALWIRYDMNDVTTVIDTTPSLSNYATVYYDYNDKKVNLDRFKQDSIYVSSKGDYVLNFDGTEYYADSYRNCSADTLWYEPSLAGSAWICEDDSTGSVRSFILDNNENLRSLKFERDTSLKQLDDPVNETKKIATTYFKKYASLFGAQDDMFTSYKLYEPNNDDIWWNTFIEYTNNFAETESYSYQFCKYILGKPSEEIITIQISECGQLLGIYNNYSETLLFCDYIPYDSHIIEDSVNNFLLECYFEPDGRLLKEVIITDQRLYKAFDRYAIVSYAGVMDVSDNYYPIKTVTFLNKLEYQPMINLQTLMIIESLLIILTTSCVIALIYVTAKNKKSN